jgi:hypothetical protein
VTIESFHPAADNPLAMRKLILVLCVTLLGSSVACRKTIRKVAGHGPARGAGDPASPAKLLAEASSLYAQGFNKLIGPMKSTVDDYEREVPDGFKGAPARKPVLALGTADRDLDEAAKLFAQAKEVTPAAQADMGQAAEAMLASARALRKDFAEAVRYYNAENYKDDKGEGAKAIASRMRISIEVYESRARKLQDRLGSIELEAMERELKELPPTVPGYHFRAVNLAAKHLVEARGQVEKVVPALEAVKKANANLKKFAETRTDLLVAFKNYIGLVDQFESQAIAFARDLREPNRDPKSLQRNTTLLVARYNNLVQMGNSLYQFEDQGLLK